MIRGLARALGSLGCRGNHHSSGSHADTVWAGQSVADLLHWWSGHIAEASAPQASSTDRPWEERRGAACRAWRAVPEGWQAVIGAAPQLFPALFPQMQPGLAACSCVSGRSQDTSLASELGAEVPCVIPGLSLTSGTRPSRAASASRPREPQCPSAWGPSRGAPRAPQWAHTVSGG